jgi:small subunit ribosomal protein S18
MADEETKEESAAPETAGEITTPEGDDERPPAQYAADTSNSDQSTDAVKTAQDRKRPGSPGQRYRSGSGRSGSGGDQHRQRRGYFRRKVCRLCVNKIHSMDYKDVDMLKRFVTDRGKILPRRMTGTCAKHQRIVSAAVKRARMVALLPYVEK